MFWEGMIPYFLEHAQERYLTTGIPIHDCGGQWLRTDSDSLLLFCLKLDFLSQQNRIFFPKSFVS